VLLVDKLSNLVGRQALGEAAERSGEFEQECVMKNIGENESMEVYDSV